MFQTITIYLGYKRKIDLCVRNSHTVLSERLLEVPGIPKLTDKKASFGIQIGICVHFIRVWVFFIEFLQYSYTKNHLDSSPDWAIGHPH